METNNKFIIELPKLESLEKISLGELKTKVHENKGIYFLFDANDILLYIGKSKNLFQRIRQHLNAKENRYNPKRDGEVYINSSSMIPEGVISYIKILIEESDLNEAFEKFYMAKYDSIFNISSGESLKTKWENYDKTNKT